LNAGDIQIHCASETCEGIRFFQAHKREIALPTTNWENVFLPYSCRNCQQTLKIYAVRLMHEKDGTGMGRAVKIGEIPSFAPPTPARVISLIGPDRDLFLKGRRAEIRGLGIGAFSYYRRVVENQKNRIIEEIARVAKKLGAKPDVLADFESALKETQF